jgi:hypothetical protein
MSNNGLEAALDGLIATVNYCEENGMDDLAERAARLYQDLGAESPEEHWENVTEEEAEQILNDIEERLDRKRVDDDE